ncbi:ATP synthase subunit I [Halomonas organivorans]
MIDYLASVTWLALAGGLFAGTGLGGVFFGGLWFTVRRLPGARRPALTLWGSLLLRFALALTCFLWLVRSGGPAVGLAGALGFLLARWAITRYLPWRGLDEEPRS